MSDQSSESWPHTDSLLDLVLKQPTTLSFLIRKMGIIFPALLYRILGTLKADDAFTCLTSIMSR